MKKLLILLIIIILISCENRSPNKKAIVEVSYPGSKDTVTVIYYKSLKLSYYNSLMDANGLEFAKGIYQFSILEQCK